MGDRLLARGPSLDPDGGWGTAVAASCECRRNFVDRTRTRFVNVNYIINVIEYFRWNATRSGR
jgi:hypothetical protein